MLTLYVEPRLLQDRHLLISRQKIRTIELDGKTVKLQIVSHAYIPVRQISAQLAKTL